MKTLIANINHAIRNNETVTIGGGTFEADELSELLTHLKTLEDKVKNYASHGVTCQTYGHTVGNCSECNTHDESYRQGFKDGMNEVKDLKPLTANQVNWELK
jgi:hypothetical protein